MYPIPPTYDLHHFQEKFMGFHDFILTFHFKRDSHPCISSDNISQILGP